MTIPWMMNCPHNEEGWCLPCVVEMGNENARLREYADHLERRARDALGYIRNSMSEHGRSTALELAEACLDAIPPPESRPEIWREKSCACGTPSPSLHDVACPMFEPDEENRIGRSDFATTPDAVETEDLRQALERARGCIKGMLARTPVRDVAETLAEIDAALECHHAYSSKDAAIREAIEVFRGFRAGCSICDDEGRELDWRDIDRRCLVAMKALEAALEP